MNILTNRKWWYSAIIRAIKTGAQAFLSTIGTTALILSDINWKVSISAAVLAMVLSLVTSLAGLPEVKDGD